MAVSARLVVRVTLLALLVALIPTGYLVFEYHLKPWGSDRLADYAKSIPLNATASASASLSPSSIPELSGALMDGVACVRCIGVNNVFPLTSTSHPTYSGFQKLLLNYGGWFVSALVIAGVAIGGGGSLLLALLYAITGTSPASSASKPTSSTASNGCGLFEMVLMLSHAQFLTMLGALQLVGAPRSFYEFTKKLAWTNLQVFPAEASYRPLPVEISSTTAAFVGSTRQLIETVNVNATGVERYALLIGTKPNHFFYYTCAALAVTLASVLVVYIVLRLILSAVKKPQAAATLDHRVIWVFLLLLMLAQYVVAIASSFQVYYTLNDTNRSTGDIALAIVIFAAVCVGLVVFAIIKLARHSDKLATHGTSTHYPSEWFHLRYSVLYQEYTLENLYFFVGKMVLDTASGAIVGTLQDAPLQVAVLIAFNGVFLAVLIWRQPFLVPLFYGIAVVTGFLRIVLLLLTLVQAKGGLFAQDVRDYVTSLTVIISIVLLLCLLLRQLYVLVVALVRWRSRSKTPVVHDEEMGIPLQDMRQPSKSTATDPPPPASGAGSTKTTKSTSSKSRRTREPPIADATLFASQPYHAMGDGDRRSSSATGRNKKGGKRRAMGDRQSMPGYSSATSTEGSTTSTPVKGGGRRSLYTRRAQRHRELMTTKDDELPDWAKM